MAALGLCCCARAFSSCGELSSLRCAGFSLWWLLLLRSTGSRHTGFSSCGSPALERRLSSCGAWALLLRGTWDLPGPGLEPVSPALAGGFTGRWHCTNREVPSVIFCIDWKGWICFIFNFKKNFIQVLKVTFYFQLLQNIGYISHVVQYILEPIFHLIVCTSHSPIPIIPLLPPHPHERGEF